MKKVKYFRKYICIIAIVVGIAFAYKLGEIKVYDTPKTLMDYGIKAAPQSFVYV